MADLQWKIVDMEGKESGSVELDPKIFDAPIDAVLVHETVRWQLAKRRAGTHSTLSRSEMKGGGKKPWRQKGTGRARAGSIISPLWVGGAIVFGPKPRKYDYRLSKRVRKQALCSALSDKAKSKGLIVVDDIGFKSGKTKDAVKFLNGLGIKNEKVIVVLPERKGESKAADSEVKSWRAVRNLENVIALPVGGLNVYDIVRSRYLVVTPEAMKTLAERVHGEAA